MAIGEYDPHHVLVVDPELVYATYLGGRRSESCRAMAVDQSGHTYVVGMTQLPDFPTSSGAFMTTASDVFGTADVFVAKVLPDGSAITFGTYIAGAKVDDALAIAVDPSGAVYVAGHTTSPDFPTRNPLQAQNAGPLGPENEGDAFVLKLDPSGSSLIYSTFLGGTGDDRANCLAVDGTGNAYIAGMTTSRDLPTHSAVMPSIPDSSLGCGFVASLTPDGTGLNYCTYLGGSTHDEVNAAAVDEAGNLYVAGGTFSDDFPVTAGVLLAAGRGGGFVTKFSPDGSIAYSTTFDEAVNAIAVDAQGNAFLAADTTDSHLPVVNAFQPDRGGGPRLARE